MKVRIALLAGALLAGLGVGAAPSSNAAITKLPRSPEGQVMVVSWNAGELLNKKDYTETLDQRHFAARVQSRLKAANAYIPDVILLQEVTRESARTIAAQLKDTTGYPFAVAVSPAPLTNAWVCAPKASRPPQSTVRNCEKAGLHKSNETTVLYNTATMTMPKKVPAGYSRLTYPKSVSTAPMWVWLGAATVQLKEKFGGGLYNFYSLHYRPRKKVQNQSAFAVQWTNLLKRRAKAYYNNAGTTIMGGDTNDNTDAVANAFRANSSNSPRSYKVARPTASAIDFLASTAPVVPGMYGYDSDYKKKKATPGGDGYFDDDAGFSACDTENAAGRYASAKAKAIDGCRTRFYSDHAFVWAVFGS